MYIYDSDKKKQISIDIYISAAEIVKVRLLILIFGTLDQIHLGH